METPQGEDDVDNADKSMNIAQVVLIPSNRGVVSCLDDTLKALR